MKGSYYTDMELKQLNIIQSVIEKKEQVKRLPMHYIFQKDKFGEKLNLSKNKER